MMVNMERHFTLKSAGNKEWGGRARIKYKIKIKQVQNNMGFQEIKCGGGGENSRKRKHTEIRKKCWEYL